jgi:hypothetical protein
MVGLTLTTLDKASRMSRAAAWDDPLLAGAARAVSKGRLGEGLALLARSQGDGELRALRVREFADAAVRHVAALEKSAATGDPDALLLLGATRIQRAWKIRGGSMARDVREDRFERFSAELEQAELPLQQAAELLPGDPAPWDQLQWHGIGMRVGRPELDRIWRELQMRSPDFYAGHVTRVQAISAKWYGSHEEAAEFAHKLVVTVPPGDPVVAIAAAAHFEIAWHAMDGVQQADDVLRDHFRQESVAEVMRSASELWLQNPQEHPRTLEAHHLLGAAFYFGGDHERARDHLAQTDHRMPHVLPWHVASLLPGRYYAKVRKQLGL